MRPTAKKPGPEAVGLGGALLLAALIHPALAQNGPSVQADAPCVLDKCLDGGTTQPQPDPSVAAPGPEDRQARTGSRAPAPGAFDFYVLSLSWSPGFCATGGAAKNYRQCEPGSGLGFVVHGLWPQNVHGYPSDCDTGARAPSRMALDSVRGLYPDDGLARHEWRTHGTCTGLSPTEYFADVRRARAAVTIPEVLRAPGDAQTMRPIDIARSFTAANPRLRIDEMAVTCRGETLAEVRICFTKDLRGYVSCPEIARASCRRPVEVPPVM